MTEADRVFERFPDFIKEYIYSRGWSELREVQLEAARVIFDTDSNLLISSSTASGKTEAALFPIITEIVNDPEAARSVSVLYIAPLKSLINDQYGRLDEVLDACISADTVCLVDYKVAHLKIVIGENLARVAPLFATHRARYRVDAAALAVGQG